MTVHSLLGLSHSGLLNNVRLYRAPSRWSAARCTCTTGLQLLHAGHHRRRIRRRGLQYRRSRRGREEQGLLRLRSGRSDREPPDGGQGLDRAEEEQGRRHPVRPEGRGEEERQRGQLRRAPRRARQAARASTTRTCSPIPLSLPADDFAPGDNISLKVLVRNSCLASPQTSGAARLWYDDEPPSVEFDEAGAADPLPGPGR